jgi:DNA-binding NtrC family response regulator
MKAEHISGTPAPPPDNRREAAPVVLLVEDEIWVRFAFADYLREIGFAVIEVGTAAEAVDILLPPDITIDLVFSDVSMPGPMDGFGLLQWTKANRPNLPIMITSGDERRRCTARDVYAHELFVGKPYDYDATASQIRELIEAARS